MGMDGDEMEERRLMQIVGQCVRHEKKFREGIMEFSEKMERLRKREGRSNFGRGFVRRKRVEDVGKRVAAESGNGGLALTFKRYKRASSSTTGFQILRWVRAIGCGRRIDVLTEATICSPDGSIDDIASRMLSG